MHCIKNNFEFAKKFFLFAFLNLFIFNFVIAAPTVSVTPDTQTLNYGQKATVKITSTNSLKCTVTGGTYKNNNVLLNGNILLNPTQTTTYTFTCTDANNESKSATTNVNVIIPKNVTPVTATPVNNSGQSGSGINPSAINNALGGASSALGQGGRAPTPQYGTQNTQTEAQNICAQYSGFQSVYGSPSIGAGGSVPVDLTQLKPVLQSIDQNSRLTANEMRAGDMIRFCKILPNVAAASERLAQESTKSLKKIADDCTADEKCYLQRAYNSDLQGEIRLASSYPVYGREIAQLVANMGNPVPRSIDQINISQQQKCQAEWAKDNNPMQCWTVPRKVDIIDMGYYDSRNSVNLRQANIASKFGANGGIIGSEPCVQTFSGADPSKLSRRDPDCADYKTQPALINQEVLRQITALPYTQAYSPAAELGVDQSINNINTRIQNGNLIDQNISPNFGSSVGGGNTGGGVGGSGATVTNGISLSTVEPNYKKILSNINVITTLYGVTRLAYASSTSVCKNIPVATRNKTIERLDTDTQGYTSYASALTASWNAAQKTQNEDHIGLITKINFDLKDKYNQDLISKVSDGLKALLQSCVDASSKSS